MIIIIRPDYVGLYLFFTVLIKGKILIYVQQPYLYTLKGEILCTKLGRLPRSIICNVLIRFTAVISLLTQMVRNLHPFSKNGFEIASHLHG